MNPEYFSGIQYTLSFRFSEYLSVRTLIQLLISVSLLLQIL
jgi:hypothetical protein